MPIYANAFSNLMKIILSYDRQPHHSLDVKRCIKLSLFRWVQLIRNHEWFPSCTFYRPGMRMLGTLVSPKLKQVDSKNLYEHFFVFIPRWSLPKKFYEILFKRFLCKTDATTPSTRARSGISEQIRSPNIITH